MTLEELFQNIRKAYFPRWDKKLLWKAMPTDELVEGYVSEKEKVIFINASILRSKIPLFRLKALMIHEIAHAVIGGGHNSRWLKRMNEAEIIAENNNEADLSREIRCDVRNYEK